MDEGHIVLGDILISLERQKILIMDIPLKGLFSSTHGVSTC